MTTEFKLFNALTKQSVSKDWFEAVKEWEFIKSEKLRTITHCICGVPILCVCYAKNKHNNNTIQLGRRCANKVFPWIITFVNDKECTELEI